MVQSWTMKFCTDDMRVCVWANAYVEWLRHDYEIFCWCCVWAWIIIWIILTKMIYSIKKIKDEARRTTK